MHYFGAKLSVFMMSADSIRESSSLTRPIYITFLLLSSVDISEIKIGSLHVKLHCFTDERFLEVFADYESGKMKTRLQEEFTQCRIEIEGLKIEIGSTVVDLPIDNVHCRLTFDLDNEIEIPGKNLLKVVKFQNLLKKFL